MPEKNMGTRTITVSDITKKRTESGNDYLIVKSNGDVFYVWDKALFGLLKPGKKLKVEILEGKYPRIISAEEVQEEKADLDGREERMIRMSALRDATILLSGVNGMIYEERVRQVKRLADQFELWIKEGVWYEKEKGKSEGEREAGSEAG
ncbi:MAG: hypothetical protein DRP12_00280 [Candidatus Aenigmatarchaeota archaeon]|nr:MAG: hypothetical protein DRP12_00280 [Candidatus Aenigmarchaeota archaeon]